MRSFKKLNVDLSRTAGNMAKMGAYYTDVDHCSALSRFLEFQETGVHRLLEPSIGDGKAISACVGKQKGDNKRIFAVESNFDTVSMLRSQEEVEIEALIEADFINGIFATNNAFDFCFSNPPYGDYLTLSGMNERLEKMFLERITKYLKVGGVLVFVIPHSAFIMPAIFNRLFSQYDVKHVYKFHEKEFEKYKQVVVIAVKKPTKKEVILRISEEYDQERKETERLKALLASYSSIEQIEDLPMEYNGERIVISTSPAEKRFTFKPKEFRVEDAYEKLMELTPLDEKMGKILTTPSYHSGELDRPPIPPKNDSLYLLAVCGVGEGLAGVEGVDLHLQRGVVKMTEESQVDEETNIETVTVSAKITLTVVEDSGKVTVLS